MPRMSIDLRAIRCDQLIKSLWILGVLEKSNLKQIVLFVSFYKACIFCILKLLKYIACPMLSFPMMGFMA